MSKSRERVGWLPSNNMVTATALLALSFSYAIQQNPFYRNVVEGFSVSRLIDGARAPQQKAGIIREVAPVLTTNNAAEVDARIIQGFMELEAERVAEERALAQSPEHAMSPDYVHVPAWAAPAVTARNVTESYVDEEGMTRTRTRVTGNIVLPRRISRAQ